jgi:hypothetical protein
MACFRRAIHALFSLHNKDKELVHAAASRGMAEVVSRPSLSHSTQTPCFLCQSAIESRG